MSSGKSKGPHRISEEHPVTFWTYTADIDKVVDGDTIDFEVDLGFKIYKGVRTRLLGVDTHETYGVKKDSDEYERGMEEKRFVESWLDDADEIFIQTEKDSKGKYGRWLARVYNQDYDCLNKKLVAEFDVGRN